MTKKKKMSPEGTELLKAVEQMKAGKKGRVYTPEQLLAISDRYVPVASVSTADCSATSCYSV